MIEIVCQSVADVVTATVGGAGRIELCTALPLGGLTPTPGLLTTAKAVSSLPILAMVRPRPGGFCYTSDERSVMEQDAQQLILSGADGLVFGCVTPEGRVDMDACRRLIEIAGGRQTTFHRAFDTLPDPADALEALIALGITRVLTSGGKSTALEGASTIATCIVQAAGRIAILPGGGVRAANVRELIARTGATEVHLAPLRTVDERLTLDFGPYHRVDGDAVRAVVQAFAQNLSVARNHRRYDSFVTARDDNRGNTCMASQEDGLERTARSLEDKTTPKRHPFPTNKWFMAAVALFVIIAILPQTGWIVRLQGLLATLSQPNARLTSAAISRLAVGVSKSEFEITLDQALTSDRTASGATRLKNLVAMQDRYDGEPLLHATILRYMTQTLPLKRIEEDELSAKHPRPEDQEKKRIQYAESEQRLSSETLAQFEHAAERGEALDPDNAFFPMALGMLRLVQHRDAEALAAIHRAGAKPHYRDYANDEAVIRWNRMEKTVGEIGAIPRMSIAAALLYPHYAVLRAEARVATVLAMHQEMAGDAEAGFTVRNDLAHIGALMRVEGQSYIASLVGSAITALAGSRPGGAPAIEGNSKNSDAVAKARLEQYISYLRGLGHEKEAVWYEAERAQLKAVKSVWAQGEPRAMLGGNMWRFAVLGGLWAAGFIVFMNVLMFLFLAGGAALLSRTAFIRNVKPLPGSVSIASGIVVVLTVFGPGLIANPLSLCAALVVLIGGGLLYLSLAQKRSWESFLLRTQIGWYLGTLLAGGVFFGGIAALGACTKAFGSQWMFTSQNPTGDNDPLSSFLTMLVGGFIIFAVPISLILTGMMEGLRGRIPVSVGIVRKLQRRALGSATGTLFVYLALVLGIWAMEHQCIPEIKQQVAHEGRYMAHLAGKEWPGFVPEGGK